MAYRAEIQIGVKGTEKLEQIKKKIQSIDQKVEQVNARWKKIRSGIPTKEFGKVNKKLQKTVALQARAKALAAATEKRLKGQNSLTRGLLGLNKAVLNAARDEAQARGESVEKQRELNRELAKTQQYSKAIGPEPAKGSKSKGRSNIGRAVGAGLSTVNLPGQDIAQAAFLGSLAGPKGAAIGAGIAVVAKGLGAIGRAGPEIAKTAAQLSKLEIALRGILGTESEKGFKAIDRAARDFNQPILDATRSFTQLSAAATANGNSVKQTETLYRALSAATKATGGDAEDLSGVLRAATQVISKGVVRSEELRGQIGDRLPGAFQLFAQATNRSAEELQKALEQGEVSADEFVTTFANFILNKYEPAAKRIGDSPAEAGARLTKALEDANRAVGPLLLALGAKFQQFAVDALEELNPLLKGINEFFRLDRKGKNDRLFELEGGGQRGKGTLELLRSERTRLAGTRRGKTVETANIPGVGRFVGKIEDAFKFLKKQEDRLGGTAEQLRNEIFPTGGLTPLKPGPNTTDEDLKGAPRAPRLPTSKGFQLQQQISQELLKQFDIKTKYMQLNMSESEALDFQNTRLRERLQREENLLEFQRQQALATSKYAADAELINKLFDTRLVTLRGQTETQIQQNSASKEQLAIQEKITELKRQEELEGLERGLRRDIAVVERRIASPFGGDEAEQIDLLVEQQRRYKDTTDQLKTSIAEQKNLELIDTSGKATKQREALEKQLSIYEKLLPQLNAVEQAELRQNQLMEKYGFIADEAATAMSSAVQSVITGTGSVQEAFSDMFANIGKAFLDMATQMIAKALVMKALNILGSAFGAASSPGIQRALAVTPKTGAAATSTLNNFLAPRANGGPVSSNTPYIVGEEGPELFIPGASGSITNNDQFEAARDALATGSGFTTEEEATLEKLGTTQQPGRLSEVLRDSRSAIESISRISKERETAGVNKLVKELGATSGSNGETISTFGSSTTNNLKERLGGDSTVEKIIAAAQQTAQAEAVSAARDALVQSGDEQNAEAMVSQEAAGSNTDSSEVKTSRDYIEKIANGLGSAGTNTVNNVSSSSTFGESRSTVDRITAINQTRQMLESVSSVNKERSVERAMESTASGDIKPIDVRYESQVINNVEYVTAEQHRAGVSQAAERGRALALQALQNSVKTRKRVGL